MPWETARKDPAYGRAPWRNARAACLRAAQGRCEIRIPGICINVATQVDHIDGLANDPNHLRLRAACGPCHRQTTARQANDAKRGSGPDPQPRPNTAW